VGNLSWYGKTPDDGQDAVHLRARRLLIICVLGAVLAVTAFVAILIGTLGPIGPGIPFKISFAEAFKAIFGSSRYHWVYWDIRLPRVLLAGLVGAALACSGTAMQAIFRNSMADPFIIGVSSGGALGAALVVLLGVGATVGIFARPMFAFASAIIAAFSVYLLGTVRGKVYVDSLLLSGVAVAAFLGAMVSFLIYFAGPGAVNSQLIFWLLGSLTQASWNIIGVLAIPVIAGVIIIFLYGRDLDALLLGEETAHNLGANPEFLKKMMLFIAALLAAAAVAFTGIIGFVGLIIPHISRLIVGSNHRTLVPAATLSGAIFLIWADTLARTVVAPVELPVGIITALCGGPFFLYLLRKNSKGRDR
jgi:iron complex transport system permease protein